MQMINRKQIVRELRKRKEITQCAREFNIIGDPTRLKVCYLLCHHKELSVSQIAELVGVSISAVSHTLRKLEEAGVVANRREFRNVFYQLKDSPLTGIIKTRLAG